MSDSTGRRRSRRRPARHLWARHDREFRDPHDVVVQWQRADDFDDSLLGLVIEGSWWELIESLGITLLVTREYEHLIAAFAIRDGVPRVSYLRLPHPNGLAFDAERGRLHVASTRNPNMIYDFAPCRTLAPAARREDRDAAFDQLLPVHARFLPGSLYLHDLAIVGGVLHGCAAGINAVVALPNAGGFAPVWWPQSVDRPRGAHPRFERNYLQLNSIAAGKTLRSSYFTASAASPGRRRPGHLDFPVNRRGVVFSGATRKVAASGLTRPHSARWWRRRVWVDDSGYGQLGVISGDRFEAVARLPGWTRGLCFAGDVAWVATSRVIPRFRRYAPGLDAGKSCCGIHAVDPQSGKVIASAIWPRGNQIFGVEAVPAAWTDGFPFAPNGAAADRLQRFFFLAGA